MSFIPHPNINMGHQLVPYRKSHLISMELGDYERYHYEGNFDDYISYVDDGLIEEFTYTIMAKGKPICIFGLRPYWKGVGEVWLLPGKNIRQNPIAVVKECRGFLDEVMYEYDLKRLQIAVSVANKPAYKFAKTLYFNEESLMERFGPEGEDYYMMVRFEK
jgi:hypothetical protein